jgi:hypothetical protein
MLTIRVQCSPVFLDEEGAIGPLVAAASVVGAASRSGLVWARCGSTPVPFDAGTIGALLASERTSRPEEPHRATHVLSLCAAPDGLGEVGVVVVNVRPGAVVRAAPGIVLSVWLDEDSFDTQAHAVLHLLDAYLDALSPDSVLVGPRDWLRELRAGWATFTRTVDRNLLPVGATVSPTHDGWLILAHAEAPGSESPAAREAVAQVRAAIDGCPPTEPPQPRAVSEAPVPAVATELPTYLASSHPALGATALTLDVPRAAMLPFAESASEQPLPAPPLPRVIRGPAHLSGTAPVLDIPRGPALPFTASASVEPPELTVEQYAAFRARLALRGEDDVETWREFGVPSRAAKEVLQARFAVRFRTDSAAQARFVELVRNLAAHLRLQATGK